MSEICLKNAEVVKEVGRMDLYKVWTLCANLLEKRPKVTKHKGDLALEPFRGKVVKSLYYTHFFFKKKEEEEKRRRQNQLRTAQKDLKTKTKQKQKQNVPLQKNWRHPDFGYVELCITRGKFTRTFSWSKYEGG